MGRPKGAKNKITTQARELADEMGVDPLKILLLFASDDWEALGYDSPTMKRASASGELYEVDRISPELRMGAAREAVRYIYPTQKAVEFTGENNGIKVVIEDYSAKS